MWVRDRREAICPGSLGPFYSTKPRLRSDHWGFAFCISAIFFERRQSFGFAQDRLFRFLLAGNGCANVVGVLEVHKTFNEVFAGKAWHQPMLVLVYATAEAVGDTDV